MNEEWLPVAGYEDSYHVSNLGNVKRLARKQQQTSHTGGAYWRMFPERLLALIKHPTGYITVRLSVQGKAVTKRVHKLVALAFIENKECKLEINHKDKDRHNNIVTNLEWCTRQENEDHKHAN